MADPDENLSNHQAGWLSPERKSASQIEISLAAPEDEKGIWDVQYRTSLASLPNEDLGITVDDIKDTYKELYKDDGALSVEGERQLQAIIQRLRENLHTDKESFVAKDNANVIGFCTVARYPDKNELIGIYILPEFHGRGIGMDLWKNASQFIDSAKDTFVRLYGHNTEAKKFYNGLGFLETDTLPKIIRHKSGATGSIIEMALRPNKQGVESTHEHSKEFTQIDFQVKE